MADASKRTCATVAAGSEGVLTGGGTGVIGFVMATTEVLVVEDVGGVTVFVSVTSTDFFGGVSLKAFVSM